MSRSRVDDRAHAIYDFLKTNLNEVYKIGSLLAAVGLQDGATTRQAIRRARDLAELDGLCFPVACPDNGMTYCVTNDPAAVLDPSMHLAKIAAGVGVRKDIHDAFIRSRMAHLAPVDRSMFNSLDKFEAAQREQRNAYMEVLSAMSKIRRSQRDEEADVD